MMRATRGLLVLIGVACGLWGLWLMRDFTGEQLRSTGLWFVGGAIARPRSSRVMTSQVRT
jgi:hypothetical protein